VSHDLAIFFILEILFPLKNIHILQRNN